MRLKTKDIITKEGLMNFPTVRDYLSKNVGQFYVYFLVDPFTFQIKYVGKGLALGDEIHSYQRCLSHWKKLSGSSYKVNWIAKLQKKDTPYLVAIWEFYGDNKEAEDLAYEEEGNFIYMFGRKGYENKGTLTNSDLAYKGGNLQGTESFVRKAVEVHKDRYSYIPTVYKGSANKIDIDCKIHGTFSQLPSSHLKGHGCPKCSNNDTLDTKEFIIKAIDVHNKLYSYTHSVYVNNKTKLDIICNRCGGTFQQQPNNHLSGQGCPECNQYERSQGRISSTSQFIVKATDLHKDRYSYVYTDYTKATEKVSILCNHCNRVFQQTPNKHLQGQGCPHRCYRGQNNV